jgi:hypothetical protein
MEQNEKINVFGKEITIQTNAVIKTVYKKNDEVVILRTQDQFTCVMETPLDMKDYGLTVEEFIAEFEKKNIEVYMKKIRNNINQ